MGLDIISYRIMPHFLKSLISWMVDALPDISNLILVLVGVIMSLPKLAERIEDHAIARYSVAAGCILLGLFGLFYSVNQRRQATSQMTIVVHNVQTLVEETNGVVTNTGNLVNSFSLAMPQILSIDAEIGGIKARLEEAKEKHNPRLIADLQAKADLAQKRSDNTSKELLLAMAPSFTDQLRIRNMRWEGDEQNEYLKYQEELNLPHAFGRTATPQEIQEADKKWAQHKADIAFTHRFDMRDALVNANSLRERIRRQLPETPEDKDASLLFAKLLSGGFEHWDVGRAIDYLQALTNRLRASQ